MLFDQRVDLTALVRRSEEEVTAMQCKFHRLQMIVFNSELC
jgi:predicted helicase